MRTDLAKQKKYKTQKAQEYHKDTKDRPWLTEIPCRSRPAGAHIYTHSETHLGYMSAALGGPSTMCGRLLAIEGVELHQAGDFEFSVTFPVEALDTVAAVVGARKRRALKKAQLDALSEAGKPFRL